MVSDFSVEIPWKRIGSSFIALIALISLYFVNVDPTLYLIIYGIGTLLGGYYFLRSAVSHVINKRKVTTDIIMTLAVLGSAILGAFEESLTIVFLYSITESLESYTVKRTKSSIKSLIELVPKEITVIEGDEEKVISVDDISVGDKIRINVGDVIPADGVIKSGSAAIDESTITGEPIPEYHTVGDTVLSGTNCKDGTFTYEVTKLPSESTVSKIIELVEDAQTRKVPVQLTIERFTRWYNPGILIFSILVFIIPSIVTSEVHKWAIIAVTLLVASSPCALAISSPVTMYSAISTAAKKGILAKGGAHLEELGKVEAIVFDKTGTLTYGEPVLTDIVSVNGISQDEILQLAGSLELFSNHPLAKAVTKRMKEEGINSLEVDNHSTIAGKGLRAEIDQNIYFFGNTSELDIPEDSSNMVLSLQSEGKTISYLTQNDKVLGIFAFTDQVRGSVVDAIDELHQRNIPVFMMTGDNKEAALSIGKSLGFETSNIFYAMTPEQKMNKVEELKNEYKLAMVGDGINDAPALALADIGIAMGIAGTDVALETADIAIMSDELPQLVKSINIGKQMKSTIIQNIILSTTILVGLLIGVLLGEVNITQAILIHEGTEVLIVINAMKLFFKSF